MVACLAEVPIQDGMLKAFALAATHGADVRVVSDVRSIISIHINSFQFISIHIEGGAGCFQSTLLEYLYHPNRIINENY